MTGEEHPKLAKVHHVLFSDSRLVSRKTRFTKRVNLREALSAINSLSTHKVTSTPALARSVNAMTPGGDLVEVDDLDTYLSLRPLDVLFALSMATRATVEQDVLMEYEAWAKWRYLGVFGGNTLHGPMALSAAGNSIRGNQRRVMSEELGIGFSVKAAEKWMNPHTDPRVIVRTVDVDAALADPRLVTRLTGTGVAIDIISTRRPDYFVIADDPLSLAKFTIGTLESKGTSQVKNWSQLSSANQQLRGVTVNGLILPGLVVGTMLNGSGVSTNALKLPDPREEQTYRAGLEVEIDIEALDFRRSRAEKGPKASRGSETLVEEMLSTSWASLGEASGNDEVFDNWASEEAKIRRQSREPRSALVSRDSRDGANYVGREMRIPVRGGTLTVFTGIERELEGALKSGKAENILRVQKQKKYQAENHRPNQGYAQGVDDERLESISDDGAIVVLEAQFTD